MTARLGIGLVGCGRIASEQHLPALRRMRGAAVVALSDPDPEARARAGHLAPGAVALDEPDALLARSDVDAVVITAPPPLHADLAVAAARAGKHVYVEKPLAVTENEARRVADEVARAGVTGTVGFNRRRHPLNVRAHELVTGGRIGRVRFVRTAFCEPADLPRMPAWQRSPSTGGGVLFDLGSHHFDLVHWLLDAELEVVGAGASSELGEQDGAWVQLSTGSGVEVQSLFSFQAAHMDVVEVVGERGLLRIDRHRGALELTVRWRARYGVRPAWARPGLDVVAWRVGRLVGRGGDPSYGRALRAFVQRIGGSEIDLPTLDDGLRSLQVVLTAERLSRTGQPAPE